MVSDENKEILDLEGHRDEMVGYLIVEGVRREVGDNMRKRLAVERYMRTYLKTLSTIELEYAMRFLERRSREHRAERLPIEIEYKVKQASQGYDDFMRRQLERAQARRDKLAKRLKKTLAEV